MLYTTMYVNILCIRWKCMYVYVLCIRWNSSNLLYAIYFSSSLGGRRTSWLSVLDSEQQAISTQPQRSSKHHNSAVAAERSLKRNANYKQSSMIRDLTWSMLSTISPTSEVREHFNILKEKFSISVSYSWSTLSILHYFLIPKRCFRNCASYLPNSQFK